MVKKIGHVRDANQVGPMGLIESNHLTRPSRMLLSRVLMQLGQLPTLEIGTRPSAMRLGRVDSDSPMAKSGPEIGFLKLEVEVDYLTI